MFGDPSPSRRLYDEFAAEKRNVQVEETMKKEAVYTAIVRGSGVTRAASSNLTVSVSCSDSAHMYLYLTH